MQVNLHSFSAISIHTHGIHIVVFFYLYNTHIHMYTSTVNFTSVEKLRTLRIAWLHRKVMVEDFRTQYAFFNGSEIYCTVDFRHGSSNSVEFSVVA